MFADRYEILGVVGRGGMGTVYRARHLGLAKVVALKILEGIDHQARFEREARAIARLDHPGCVRVLDCGRDEDEWRPYIVMELLEGSTLAHLLRDDGHLSPGRAVAIAKDLVAALAHAHAQGVLHRDLKPENIILALRDRTPRAVLIDFGLAHLLDEAGLTARGMCLGSPSYVAPERLAGQEYDARADLYGIGVLLYEMLAGAKPFTGATIEEILMRCRDRPARPLRAIRTDVSPALERFVTRAMAKDPARRFADAAAMQAALDEVSLADEPVQTVPRVRHEAAVTMALVLGDLERASRWTRLWSWLRFRRWRWT